MSKILLSLIIIVDAILISTLIVLNFSEGFFTAILLFDVTTCIILFIHFIKGYSKSADKSNYLKKNFLELIVAIPFDLLLIPIVGMNYLNALKLIRVLLLIAEFFNMAGGFLKNTRLDEILGVFLIIIIGSTMGLYLIDPSMNNLFDDLWFVIVSLTTVGYGDITPKSIFGKVFSLILLIVGVFIFSAITGAISSYFMDNLLQEGSYHIHELKDKVAATESELKKANEKLDKNEKKIDDLQKEIIELKEIIKEK